MQTKVMNGIIISKQNIKEEGTLNEDTYPTIE
jgi:hypothetical protein